MIALSTAFAQTLIAIDINGKRDFLELPSECKQSENVLAAIDSLLDKNGLCIADNDSYAVVLGPGSFTGLRIGASLVKGLCAGSKKQCKVVGLSSLQLMAYQYIKREKVKRPFVTVINALGGLCFVCEFSASGERLGEEKLISMEEYKAIKLDKIGLKGEGLSKKEVALDCQTLLERANAEFCAKNFVDAKRFSPVYLRKSQAEASFDEKQKQASKKI